MLLLIIFLHQLLRVGLIAPKRGQGEQKKGGQSENCQQSCWNNDGRFGWFFIHIALFFGDRLCRGLAHIHFSFGVRWSSRAGAACRRAERRSSAWNRLWPWARR